MHWHPSPQERGADGESINSHHIDQVIEAGVCGRLVEVLLHKPTKMIRLALSIVVLS